MTNIFFYYTFENLIMNTCNSQVFNISILTDTCAFKIEIVAIKKLR